MTRTNSTMRLYFTGLFLLLGMFLRLNAQEFKVLAKLDSNSIRIGEQAHVTLSVYYKKGAHGVQIKWPEVADTIINTLEVVEVSKTDTLPVSKNDNTNLIQRKLITITSFDSGYYAIPPFQFVINGDTAHPYLTEALLFQVHTVKVDTSKAIKDIKPPLHEPFHWKELIPSVLWGLVGLAVLLLLIYLYKKYKKQPAAVVVESKPKVPPHILALQELEKIKQEKLWQEGKVKLYYSRVTDALRVYIEGRFKIPALEQTSDEIMAGFRTVVIDDASKEKLKQIFLLSDLVKFAKEQPLPNENELCLTHAFDFINGTSREESNV